MQDFKEEVRDLQLFNREADQLDASTSAQAKLLENLDVGDNQLQLGDKESAAVINYYLKWIYSTKNKVRSIEFSRSLLSEIENEVLYQSDLIHEAVERGTSTLNSPSNDLMIEFENQQLTSNCLTLMLQWNQLLQSIEEVKKRLQTNRKIRRTDKHRIGEEKKAGTFIEVEKSLEDTKRRFCEARKSLEHRVAGLGSAELTEGHFDGDAILSNYNDLRNDVEHLRTPLKNRKEALDQSMKFQEFTFDLQRELEWISEKVTIVFTDMEIQTLQQAQSFGKKHKKLEEEVNNHSVVVDKVVECGEKLLSGPSYATEIIAMNGKNCKKISAAATKQINSKHPDAKLIKSRDLQAVDLKSDCVNNADTIHLGDVDRITSNLLSEKEWVSPLNSLKTKLSVD